MASTPATLAALLVILPLALAIIHGQAFKKDNTKAVEKLAKESEEKDIYEAQASYEYPHYYHDHHHGGYGYHHHHVSHVNDEALKGLLVPLVGVAFLGATLLAAANPVLLQIGVIGGSVGKKRRRRAAPKFQDLRVLEQFLQQIPKPLIMAEEKKLQASYLQCSGIADKANRCFERVTCEIGKPSGNSTSFEKQVLDIVLSDIMRNEFLPIEIKQRITQAQKVGYQERDCSQYYCKDIDSRFSE